jgi:hypothetical protein
MLFLKRAWIQVSSDRRRLGLLCAAVVLGLLLWARLIIVSNLPKTAVAEEAAEAIAAADGSGAAGRAADPGERESGSEKRRRAPVRIELPLVPERDPFALDPRHFPKPTTLTGLEQDDRKSPPSQAEDAEQQEALRQARLKALAEALTLDAVLSAGPMAVIGGKEYRLGDSVPAGADGRVVFRLMEVGHRSAVVECEGRRFDIRMP